MIINKEIAFLSGKGGTGKTLLSVNLAALSNNSKYIDCDVEEPNGNLFFKAKDLITEEIIIKIPYVNKSLCTGCRKCVDFCKFNAMAYIYNRLLIFENICHSCGGCILLCPNSALIEKEKVIGVIEKGTSQGIKVYTGILNIGEASGIPIIKKLLSYSDNDNGLTFIDCPPGSACIVMESIKNTDYCVLVTEPTIFGLHNLNMVYKLVKLFNKPFGVVINKVINNENQVHEFCLNNHIKILGTIPFDKELGNLNSNGKISVNESKKFHNMFSHLLSTILKEVQNETFINS